MKKVQVNNYECGDCQHNMGDNGEGCRCEITKAFIDVCNKPCDNFLLMCDLEEE